MKTRNGFVSNSSSTSFLIHITDENRHLVHQNYMVTETDYEWNDSTYKKGFENNPYWRLIDETENYKVYGRDIPLRIPTNLSRDTSIAFGEDLLGYKWLLKVEGLTDISNIIKEAIDNYGADNVLFLRESDEGMGGYLPPELAELTHSDDVIAEFEWH